MFLRISGSRAVAIAFVIPCAVLLTTVRTSVGFWDTGDLQTVAWIGGIPYPTGYPLYVVVGWLWTHAIPVASVAARLNALSAIAVAASAATICGLALLFEADALFAILGGWTFAFAHTVWFRATYADAHPVGFAVALLALSLGVRWVVRADPRAAAGSIVAAGVALAFDNTTILLLAGGLLLVFARRVPPRLALGAAAVALLILAASYAYLPLRSAQVNAARLDPTLALGIEPGRPFWDDHHPSTVHGFRALVAGTDWSTGSTLANLGTMRSIGATVDRYYPDVDGDFTAPLALAGLLGLAFLAASRPWPVAALAIAAALPALFGGSYRAEADPERYAFMLYAVLALGIGLAADRVVRAVTPGYATAARRLAAGLLALSIGRAVFLAGDLYLLRDDREPANVGAFVAAATRDDAVIVVPWDWATALAYRSYVEGAFGRRIVVCGFADDYWVHYATWTRTRQVVVIGTAPPNVPGFRVRRIAQGKPNVYEIARDGSVR